MKILYIVIIASLILFGCQRYDNYVQVECDSGEFIFEAEIATSADERGHPALLDFVSKSIAEGNIASGGVSLRDDGSTIFILYGIDDKYFCETGYSKLNDLEIYDIIASSCNCQNYKSKIEADVVD